jgi:large subunit ribosomal protein L30
MNKLVAIRIRGSVRKLPDLKLTLDKLRLRRKNQCVIVNDTPMMIGMLRRVESCITWGKASDEAIKELIEKRGSEKNHTHFKLSPPRGGFERGGIRKYIKMNGAHGRREKMDDILRKMI